MVPLLPLSYAFLLSLPDIPTPLPSGFPKSLVHLSVQFNKNISEQVSSLTSQCKTNSEGSASLNCCKMLPGPSCYKSFFQLIYGQRLLQPYGFHYLCTQKGVYTHILALPPYAQIYYSTSATHTLSQSWLHV